MIDQPRQPASRPEHGRDYLSQMRRSLRIREAMIDEPEQPVSRPDLGRYSLFLAVVVVTICQFPIFLWRFDLARYVLPVGWLVLLVLELRRMWTMESDDGLTSVSLFVRILGAVCYIGAFGALAYVVLANVEMVETKIPHANHPSLMIGWLVFVVNGVFGLGVRLFNEMVVGRADLRCGGLPFGQSRQLVLRSELYRDYLLGIVVIVSILEIPVFLWRLEVAKYVLPVGWLVLLILGIRRMWLVKIENDLTSELQAYKIVVGVLGVAMLGWATYQIWAYLGTAEANHQYANIDRIKLPFAVNGAIVFVAWLGGIIAIWLVDKVRAARDHDII